jgi:hypothetical protein
MSRKTLQNKSFERVKEDLTTTLGGEIAMADAGEGVR